MVENNATFGTTQGEQKKKISKTKLIPPIVFGISVIILFIIKYAYKDISTLLLIGIGSLILIVCGLIFFGSMFAKIWEQKGLNAVSNIPKPITIGEAEAQRERVFKNKKYGTNVGRIFGEQVGSYGEENKQLIWHSIFKGYNTNLLYFYGLNLHFWESGGSILILGEFQNEKTYEEIYKKNKLAIDGCLKRLPTDTERPANTVTTKIKNQSLGYEEERIEKTHDRDNKKKEVKEALE